MGRLIFILSFCFSVPAEAQKLYLYPTAAVAPRGSYQTVTAVVTGVNNKTVTWSIASGSGGTLVGTNPCVVNEPCTIALHTTTAGTYTVTATSNANGSVTATSTITMTASPTPASTHPRLIVTSGMISGLQAKATSRNTIYQAIKNYTTAYSYNVDNRTPISWSWTTWNGTTCAGSGTGLPANDQSGHSQEDAANMMAFMSMIAPTSGERNSWGCHGRDVWTYVMNQVILGNEVILGNHWSDSAQYFALTTDWLMAGGYLSSADQALARHFLAYITKTILGYGYGLSTAVSPYNAPSLFQPGNPSDLQNMRTMGNNYTMSKMLYLAAAGLTFNDTTADDPPLTNTCNAARYQMCPDFSAGSLHAYFSYLAGSMLYMNWAHLEDPTVSQKAYNAAFSNLPGAPNCRYV